MLGDGKPNSGTQGSYWRYQYASLKLLEEIRNAISALPGIDFETRTTTYQATANGAGYSTGDIIVRYDIINVAASTVASTIWFNQTTQSAIATPLPSDITPVSAPTSVTVINGVGGAAVNIQDGGNSITIDAAALDVALSTRASSGDITALSAAITGALGPLATEATLLALLAKIANGYGAAAGAVRTASQIGNTTGAADFGAGVTGAQTLRVVLPTDQTAIPVTAGTAATSTNTSVAQNATAGGVTLLAANPSRKGATISNDSGDILYVLFAAVGTVSSSTFTVRLGANDYYEVPFGYSGEISGIWASAGLGNALISELT